MTHLTFTPGEIADDCDSSGRSIMMDPELWNTCAKCHGIGSERRQDGMGGTETGLCRECHGEGGEVTVKGRRMVEFLQRALKLEIG